MALLETITHPHPTSADVLTTLGYPPRMPKSNQTSDAFNSLICLFADLYSTGRRIDHMRRPFPTARSATLRYSAARRSRNQRERGSV